MLFFADTLESVFFFADTIGFFAMKLPEAAYSRSVDSNASAYSTEILGEMRNKYVEDPINVPAVCANT